jgi:hypothetical protein
VEAPHRCTDLPPSRPRNPSTPSTMAKSSQDTPRRYQDFDCDSTPAAWKLAIIPATALHRLGCMTFGIRLPHSPSAAPSATTYCLHIVVLWLVGKSGANALNGIDLGSRGGLCGELGKVERWSVCAETDNYFPSTTVSVRVTPGFA